MKRQRKILIVDDKEQLLKDWEEFLEEENFGKIATESNGEKAIELNKTEKFDLALLDIRLEQKLDGIDVLRAIRKDTPGCYCIMITAYEDLDPATEALKLDANDYLIKGILKKNDLVRAVANGIRWLELREENIRLEVKNKKIEKTRYEELLGFSAGVIHEISPLIIPLQTYIERECKKYKNDALLTVDHLSKLNNQLKGYVCGVVKHYQMEKLDLADIIEDSVVLMGGIPKDIKLDGAYTIRIKKDNRLYIHGDKENLHIVFRNLISNAVEAIQIRKNKSRKLKGKITIVFHKTGKNVEISVSDNGCGIPNADSSKIIKPFVTSKGNGIGLGLVIVKKILENHKGTLSFDSQVNEGTAFKIRLPLTTGVPK